MSTEVAMKARLWGETTEEFPHEIPRWTPSSNVFAADERFGVIAHASVVDAEGRHAYDQPVWVEPPGGAVIVPVFPDGRLVFVVQQRPAAAPPDRPLAYPPSHLTGLGVRSLELPRGFPEYGESAEQAALREAHEETGHVATAARVIGRVNPNTTFFAHSIAIVEVALEANASRGPSDANEQIDAVVALALDDALRRVASGEIFCGFTQAALLSWIAARRPTEAR
jgi:8-oxo-dGTP pyrophosphatase MutT (NUDIX family)